MKVVTQSQVTAEPGFLTRAEVLARYAPTPLYRTDEVGDVTLRSDGTRLWVRAARDAGDARTTSRATVGPREQRR